MAHVALLIQDISACGGVEKVMHGLARDLRDSHQVTLVSVREGEPYWGRLEGVEYRTLGLPATGTRKNFRHWVTHLRRLMLEARIEVMVSGYFAFHLAAQLAARGTGGRDEAGNSRPLTRVIAQEHSAYHHDRRAKRVIKHLLYRHLDVLQVLNEVDAECWRRRGLQPTVIPNYLDDLAERETRAECERQADVVMVGRLAPIKRVDLAIRAFAHSGYRRGRLVLVGDGPERESLLALCHELGLKVFQGANDDSVPDDTRVLFTGALQDVSRELRRARLLLLTSERECLPMNVLEAKREGLPCLSRPVRSGPLALIRHDVDGVLSAEADSAGEVEIVQELAHELARLEFDDHRLLHLSKAARESFAHYSRDAVLPDYQRLITRLVPRRRPMADVSVIMPNYGYDRRLHAAVDSVLAQSEPVREILISDDASPDGAAARLREDFAALETGDVEIRILETDTNGGPGRARNRAIAEAQGRYIAFLDADDAWLPEKIERQIAFMQETGAGLSYTGYEMVDEQGNHVSHFAPPARLTRDDMLRSNSIGCLTAIYDAGRFGRFYMPTIRKRQDLALWLIIIGQLGPAQGMPEPLARYTRRESSVSSNKFKAAAYQWRLYREVLGMDVISASRNFVHYAVNGYAKHR
ncbi:glycosyltransferase [Cobetia sp. ICG0124]|nr:glycosyltransferase [Cobetia sp. ICG0124]